MMARLFVISLWFQVIWLMAVLGQESWQWITLLLGLMTLGYSVFTRSRDIGKIVLLGTVGIAVDWLNSALGLLVFKSAYVPVWLAVLWFVFIWYARQWLPQLYRYPQIWVVLCTGSCGTFSYWAGYRLSAVGFSYPVVSTIAVLSVQWCFIGWLIMRVFANDDSNSINNLDGHITRRNKS